MAVLISIAAAISFAGAAAIYWRVRRYARALRIPAARDDAFTFLGGEAQAVLLDATGFTLDSQPRAGSTVLLELHVRASIAGAVFDPYVEHAAGRQYFERGARGRRYLNLSASFAAEPAPRRIGLRGRHLRWRDDARLLVFDAPRLDGRSRLVVAPHPDDAELAAFGLYAQASSFVLTISAGERSHLADEAGIHALQRVEASLATPQLGGRGREHCANLAFPDAMLRAMHDDRALECQLACEPRTSRRVLRAANSQLELARGESHCRWSDLVAELVMILRARLPAVIVCPHPLLDAHPDHVYTAVATAEALAESGHRPEAVLLYAVHALNAPLHPLGGRANWVSLPPGAQAHWVAETIYSHALPEDVRAAKRRAIELAPDLRPPSPPRGTAGRLIGFARACSALVSGLPQEPADFLRRCARPNEIYFHVSAARFAELARRAAAGGSPVHPLRGRG